MATGKLIAIEASDGSGKATQAALLCQYLAAAGHSVRKVEFPDYASPAAAPLKMYLNGEFGSRADAVSPYAAATFFAVDRYASYNLQWRDFYSGGGIVVADRYTTSNLAHQAAKLAAPAERAEFCRWLLDFEHERLGLPRPDCVIFLDLAPAAAGQLLAARAAATGTAPDIHEQDSAYLARCHAAYRALAAEYGWTAIRCDEAGAVRTIEAISRDVCRAACLALGLD